MRVSLAEFPVVLNAGDKGLEGFSEADFHPQAAGSRIVNIGVGAGIMSVLDIRLHGQPRENLTLFAPPEKLFYRLAL